MTGKELVLKEMFYENKKYLGFNNICSTLIEKGFCITTKGAIDFFIEGGIWDFVKQEPLEDGINLIKLSINKEDVYNSEIYNKHRQNFLQRKQYELEELNKQIQNIEETIEELV